MLAGMCLRGNQHAVTHYEQMQTEWRRAAIESGEIVEPESPLNTIGNTDAREADLPSEYAGRETEYPANWSEIATTLKNHRKWRCELCLFQLAGSSLIQVHHVDQDKSNNERSNLQVLCAICHGEKHRNSPVWPTGALESDMSKLIAYQSLRRLKRMGRLCAPP